MQRIPNRFKVLCAAVVWACLALGATAGDGVTCAYDAAGRLQSAVYCCTGTYTAVYYQYDDAGNRVRLLKYGPADGARDMDGDTLSDLAELRYFGNLVSDANGDNDGDGVKNGDEFLHGGDPTRKDTDGDGLDDGAELVAGTGLNDPHSVFQVAHIEQVGGGAIRVGWDARAGRTYQLQICRPLGTPWQVSGAPYAAIADGPHYEQRSDGTNAFYRLSVTMTAP